MVVDSDHLTDYLACFRGSVPSSDMPAKQDVGRRSIDSRRSMAPENCVEVLNGPFRIENTMKQMPMVRYNSIG